MPPHILVITDDDDNRELLIRLLQSQGQQVTVAADGQEALELLSLQVFDLILLDLDAADPDMREVETLRQLCSTRRFTAYRWQSSPTLAISI
jgi:CheY-like chemotaxis protein